MPVSVVWTGFGLGSVLVILVSPLLDGARALAGPRRSPIRGTGCWHRVGSACPGPVRPAGVGAQPPVAGVEHQERKPRDDAGPELDDHVDPDRRPGEYAA